MVKPAKGTTTLAFIFKECVMVAADSRASMGGYICGMMSLLVKFKTEDSVKCEVVDGGELKSRSHLNVRGKSATLPSITEKDWDDIKFGVDNQVDFYAVSFVKDPEVIHELKNYLKSCGADIQVIPKIESADSIPNLHSIITASDGAMVARGDLGAELPIEEVPLLQEEIINMCRSMGKAVIVATNMLESMIVHPTPTRAEVSDIAIAVREGADAVMLSGETAHGKWLHDGQPHKGRDELWCLVLYVDYYFQKIVEEDLLDEDMAFNGWAFFSTRHLC